MKKITAAKQPKITEEAPEELENDQEGEITFSTPVGSEMTATIPLQNNFYRDRYKVLFATLILCISGCLFTLGIALYIILSKPPPVYFPTVYHKEKNLPPAVSEFSIVPQTSIDKPNMTDVELSQWLVNAIVKSFSLSSQEYSSEINNAKKYFSDSAWDDYVKMVNNMVQFDTLTNRQALVSVLAPVGAPIIDNQGTSDGRYLWIFKLPVIIRFYGSQNLPDQTMNLTIIVGRISMEDNVYGIKIGSIIASDIKRVRNYNGPARQN